MTTPELITQLCDLCQDGFMPRGTEREPGLMELERRGLVERTLGGGWRPTRDGHRQAETWCACRSRPR